jgi:DNA-binding NarL/FixJ family response regulator
MPPDGLDEGIRAATALRAAHPRIGVLVLSLYLDVSAALTLVERGAARRGYLLKQRLADADELLRALRAVASGQSFMDDEVVTRLFAARRASGLDRLTAREAEVLGEMAGGRSNGAIAERLGIGRRAVEKHINSIFSKLELTDAADSDRRVRSVLLWLADGAHGGGASTIADVTGR